MKLLLDTHTFLWWINDAYVPSLSKTVYSLLTKTDHLLYLSMASVWEIAIKVSIGKLTLT